MEIDNERTFNLFRFIFDFSLHFYSYGIRGVYYTFVLKKEPLQSLNIVPKIRFKVKKGSVLEIAEKEKKQEKYSQWG